MKTRNNKEILTERHSIIVRWPIVWKFAPNLDPICINQYKKPPNKVETRDPVYRKSRLQHVSIFSNKSKDTRVQKSKLISNTKNVGSYGEKRISCLSPFRLCGSEWSLVLSPILDNSDEFLAAHLVSLSDTKEIFAGYEITIRNQVNDENLVWRDPDGVVRFSTVQEGNNEWGCDDFISMDELESADCEYLSDHHLHFEVQLEVYRDERIRYENPITDENVANSDSDSSDSEVVVSLTSGVQNVSLEQSELLALAKEDISSVLKKLSKGRDADVQKMQEDSIVKARLQRK